MDITLIIIGWILIIVGFAGCILPALPGPPIAFCALLIARLIGEHTQPSTLSILIALTLTIIVTVIDLLIPSFGAKWLKCSKQGVIGCAIGTIIGLFFLPLGMIYGPFFGALIGELIARKDFASAFVASIGSVLGFLIGIGVKLICCIAIAIWYLVATI